MLLELHPEALAEFDAAVVWHDRERPGHGILMYEEVRKRIAQAARLPKSGAPVVGFDARYDVLTPAVRGRSGLVPLLVLHRFLLFGDFVAFEEEAFTLLSSALSLFRNSGS